MKKNVFLGLLIGIFSIFVSLTPAQSEQEAQERVALSQFPFSCEQQECQTQEIKTALPFNSFVIEWPESALLRIRFFEHGAWTTWFTADGENDSPDTEHEASPYQFYFFSHATGFQVKTTRDGISKALVTYFSVSTEQKKAPDRVRMAVNETSADISIRARTEWIVPALELSSARREELWPSGYEGIKKIIIHHTATEIRDMNDDELIDTNDYQQAVRAIYTYQAKSRGWGDIGYQYIIAPDGAIWEGRFGGDGVVGGHTYRDKACKKFGQSDIGFNRGSIGISLLGTYENGDISPQAKEALTSLIARKAWEFDFEPAGTSFFVDKEYPNVIAHRDLDCTSCPGKKLYAYLPAIVEQAQQKYQWHSSSQQRLYQGEILDVFPQTVELKQGEERTVPIRFRNTGTVAWRNYGDTALSVADAGIKKHLASLDVLRLAAIDDAERDEDASATSTVSDFSRARLINPNVRPGEIGTFILSIKDPPKDLIEERRYVFALGNRGWISAQEIVLEVVNTGLPFAATILKEDTVQEVLDDETRAISFRFKNRGTEKWKKGEVALSFTAGNFLKRKQGRISFLEEEVAQGDIATFQALATLGRIGDIVSDVFLEKDKEKIIGSAREQVRVSIKPAYAAQFVSSTIPTAVLSGWRTRAVVSVKNVGTRKWDAAALASISKEISAKSAFQDSSWKGSAEIDKAKGVEPGTAVSFLFKMKAPRRAGLYKERLVITNGKRTIYFLTGDGFEKETPYEVRVDEAKNLRQKKKEILQSNGRKAAART